MAFSYLLLTKLILRSQLKWLNCVAMAAYINRVVPQNAINDVTVNKPLFGNVSGKPFVQQHQQEAKDKTPMEKETIKVLISLLNQINAANTLREQIRLLDILINLAQHVVNNPVFAAFKPIVLKKLDENSWHLINYSKYYKAMTGVDKLMDPKGKIKYEPRAYL